MIILGIETSCDDTAAAVIKAENDKISVLSNVVSSQIKLHAKWGGVVPNLASREHLKNILPVIEKSLLESKKTYQDIDLISVTNGPGLIPALLIGTTTAKTLSYIWKKPLTGIHHIEGHIYANLIGKKINSIKFPLLCLVVSGGHTQLVLMRKHLDYKIVGETLDDAAGEAFDKVARILGLGYPGGPIISQRVQNYKNPKNSFKVNLPRPMINSQDFNFSFSGLKTAVLYTVKKNQNILKHHNLIDKLCFEFQEAVTEVLVHKTLKAVEKYKPRTVMLAGGVSANERLRSRLKMALKKEFKSIDYIMPNIGYSIDNASMIATAAYFRFQSYNKEKREKLKLNWKKIKTEANLKLK